MTKITLSAATALLALSLAACDPKTETVTTQAPDPQAAELAKAPKIELPPSIKSSETFRCKDNSLAFVDFMSDGKTVHLRTEKGGTPVSLVAPAPGEPMVADGYSMTGTPAAITLAQPGKPSQPCKN